MHCKAKQVLGDLFSINQGNGSEVTFVAWATKVNLKNLKMLLSLYDLMQAWKILTFDQFWQKSSLSL